jgi:hypothetical protein
LTFLVCGIGVALLLLGCTASFKAAIRKEADGSFTFAYCDQVKGNTVRVVGITKDNDYVYLLKASSPSVTDVPTSIHLGSDFGDFKNTGALTHLDRYTSLNVLVQTSNGGSLAESRGAVFKIAAISASRWLRSDGSTAALPCSTK